MGVAENVDGDVVAALRGFLSSIVTNRKVFASVIILSALIAAAGWAFIPDVWQQHRRSGSLVTLAWALLVTFFGLLGTALPIGLTFHKEWVFSQRNEEKTARQEEAETELVGLLQGYLTPLLEYLPSVADAGNSGTEALATIRKGVMGTLQAICGPPGAGVRVVWFEAAGLTLAPKDWAGGASQSQRRFVKNVQNGAGVEAWTTAASGIPRLFRDLSQEAPRGYTPGVNSSYQTFITCGVLGEGGEVRGMLNVDAPGANLLTEVDAVVVGVCCKLLSAAYALSDRRGIV